jgi:hypothetical protein
MNATKSSLKWPNDTKSMRVWYALSAKECQWQAGDDHQYEKVFSERMKRGRTEIEKDRRRKDGLGATAYQVGSGDALRSGQAR